FGRYVRSSGIRWQRATQAPERREQDGRDAVAAPLTAAGTPLTVAETRTLRGRRLHAARAHDGHEHPRDRRARLRHLDRAGTAHRVARAAAPDRVGTRQRSPRTPPQRALLASRTVERAGA